uniref:Uncharacterized protein n=1 Tax=Peronospora matthiolae TaxID=2874970 RepID=A0AAV1UQI0_9STRA
MSTCLQKVLPQLKKPGPSPTSTSVPSNFRFLSLRCLASGVRNGFNKVIASAQLVIPVDVAEAEADTLESGQEAAVIAAHTDDRHTSALGGLEIPKGRERHGKAAREVRAKH